VNIIFKGRHTAVQERFRQHATAKLDKIGRLDQKAIRIDVEVTQERNPRQSGRRERVELTIRSRGPAIRAEAAADDRFVALDRAFAKLEARLRRSGDRRKGRYGGSAASAADELAAEVPGGFPEGAGGRPGGAGAALAGAGGLSEATGGFLTAGPDGGAAAVPGARQGDRPEDHPDAEPQPGDVPIAMDGDGPLVVREKFHPAAPMAIDQALLEMELVGHDFFLFQDSQCGLPSVVYRRHGYDYGVIRLIEAQDRALAQVSTGAAADRRGR
jgi:ribosomal subunit interface protein